MSKIEQFKDIVVLVTGAGRGIGLGIGKAFAAAGAKVVFHYHTSQQTAEETLKQIRRQGGEAISLQADITHPEEVEHLFSAVKSAFGQLDVLINNAGTYPINSLLDLKADEWDAVINSNLRSVFLCTQAAGHMMKIRKSGSIISLASIEGNFPTVNHAHYCAAKAGVIQFTKTAARELGCYNIRVNAISPGLIHRPGLEQDWPEGVARWQKNTPLARLGTPQDIANACLFLASPAASWITGVNLPVDGGASTSPAF
jgi:NAD(P)-dependent dehydrogenase (short-subunit alcohol dehydrogenase family)